MVFLYESVCPSLSHACNLSFRFQVKTHQYGFAQNILLYTKHFLGFYSVHQFLFSSLVSILSISFYSVHQFLFCLLLFILSISFYSVHQFLFCPLVSIRSISFYSVHQFLFCPLVSIMSISFYSVHQFLFCPIVSNRNVSSFIEQFLLVIFVPTTACPVRLYIYICLFALSYI